MGRKKNAPNRKNDQGLDAPLAHRRPGYPLSGCVPAEPDSVSPGNIRLAEVTLVAKVLLDTGAMP